MELSFYGGAREVGRNCIGLRDGRSSLLLDCGVNVGAKDKGDAETDPSIDNTTARAISEIAISHAHLDHIGYLPLLYSPQKGCQAKLYCTEPTRDLMNLLLADYQRISKRFSVKDIARVAMHCHAVKYNHICGNAIKFSFHNAGHIQGSSLILVHGKKRVLYTGDMSNRSTRTLEPCHSGLRAENLIMECTYGADEDKHESLKDVTRKLLDAIESTLLQGGSILIPSFAVGRAQEVLFMLEQHMTSGALSNVPIYVDGMILKANRIYRQNIEFAKDEVRRRVLQSGQDPFESRHFRVPRSKMKHDVFKQQAIIVSTSGMLSGGPALTYLRELAPNPANLLAFVGYQAEGTLGRKILDGEREVELTDKFETHDAKAERKNTGKGQARESGWFGMNKGAVAGEHSGASRREKLKINMRVEKFDLSAHSDQAGLVQFARTTKNLKRIFIIHGEEKQLAELAHALGKYDVTVPRNGERYEV